MDKQLAQQEASLRQAADNIARSREAYGGSASPRGVFSSTQYPVSPRVMPQQPPHFVSQPAMPGVFAPPEPQPPQVLATADSGVRGMKWALMPEHELEADPWDAIVPPQQANAPAPIVVMAPPSPRSRSMSPRPSFARPSSPRVVALSPSHRAHSPRAMPEWMKGLLAPQDGPVNNKNNQIFF